MNKIPHFETTRVQEYLSATNTTTAEKARQIYDYYLEIKRSCGGIPKYKKVSVLEIEKGIKEYLGEVE